MKVFRYTANVSHGRIVDKTINARDIETAVEKIRRLHYHERLHNLKVEEIVK